jgi:hypothetical protein
MFHAFLNIASDRTLCFPGPLDPLVYRVHPQIQHFVSFGLVL